MPCARMVRDIMAFAAASEGRRTMQYGDYGELVYGLR
jgi:hypothetical protein